MIKIEKVDKSYMCCNSCQGKDGLTSIVIGFDERQTSTFRLCKKCLAELKELLEVKENDIEIGEEQCLACCDGKCIHSLEVDSSCTGNKFGMDKCSFFK